MDPILVSDWYTGKHFTYKRELLSQFYMNCNDNLVHLLTFLTEYVVRYWCFLVSFGIKNRETGFEKKSFFEIIFFAYFTYVS